jgi:hypothetical protein
MRVMARLPQTEALAPLWGWLAQLPAALRTSLAATLLLGGFAASFWLSSGPGQQAQVAAASLDAVPRTELVSYLLNSGNRVEASDLAVLTAANPDLTTGFMQASADELNEVLDAQPSDELTYF